MLVFSDVFTCRCFLQLLQKTDTYNRAGGTAPTYNKSTIDFDNGQIACRQRHGLLYPSQYQSSAERATAKARKLRQKIGGGPDTAITPTRQTHANAPADLRLDLLPSARTRAGGGAGPATISQRQIPADSRATSTNWSKAGGGAQLLLTLARGRCREDHLACITQGLFKPR